MGKVVVVTSGKGGVGKTTSTAALGAALATFGQNVVVVDFDVGLRNLDLVMGAERRVVYDLINVVQGIAKLPQALIRDKRIDTLSLLPASQTHDKDALTEKGVARVIADLRRKFDWVICDSPAGIERGATLAMRHADIAIVVANPEVSSVRDSDRIIGLLDVKTVKAEKGERTSPRLYGCREEAQGRNRSDDHSERQEGFVGSAIRAESRMNFGFFRRRGTASVARERLQVLLAHERNFRGPSDLIAVLRDEILAVIAKHVTMEPDNVQIKMDRGDSVTMLKIDVEISTSSSTAVVLRETRRSTRAGSGASVRPCKSSR